MVDILEEILERAKVRAKENIEKFLKKFDKKAFSEEIEDNEFYARKDDEDDVVKILDEYDTRKTNVRKEISKLLRNVREESKNGYVHLSKKEKYNVVVKRRTEAEKILMMAHLGSKDTKKMLVPALEKLYRRYSFHKLDRYTPNGDGVVNAI